MECRKIQKLIPVYLDKELEPKERQVVMEHLSGCPVCQKELEAFEASWAMLGELNDVAPEPGFMGKFWTRVALDQTWQERVWENVHKRFFKKRLIPVLVTACMVVMVGSFSLRYYFENRATDRMLANLSQEDLAMVENIELAQNLDLIQEIDFLEDLDTLEYWNVQET